MADFENPTWNLQKFQSILPQKVENKKKKKEMPNLQVLDSG